jgi:hypothetical protein
MRLACYGEERAARKKGSQDVERAHVSVSKWPYPWSKGDHGASHDVAGDDADGGGRQLRPDWRGEKAAQRGWPSPPILKPGSQPALKPAPDEKQGTVGHQPASDPQ